MDSISEEKSRVTSSDDGNCHHKFIYQQVPYQLRFKNGMKDLDNSPKSYDLDNFQQTRRLILQTPFSTRSIISYGLIVYAKDTKRWALIQRKHSVEFLLFIRGFYRITHLPLLLFGVTKNEATIIRKCLDGGPSIFENLYIKELDLDSSGLQYALIRMAESRNIVINLLSNFDFSKNQLEWTWPKGRLSYASINNNNERETPFSCAKREFTEEVEITLPPPLFISDTYVSENIHTITGRNIESRYWIYVIPDELFMPSVGNHPEVSDRQWVNTDTCQQFIRHQDLFKQIVDIVTDTCDLQS